MKYKNTLQKGSVRYIIFREENNWYGVGLEFNIVESGSTPQEAMLLLFEAIRGYVESAKKIKARPYILNQKSDSEYEQMWKQLSTSRLKQKELKSVFSFGQMNIPLSINKVSFTSA